MFQVIHSHVELIYTYALANIGHDYMDEAVRGAASKS